MILFCLIIQILALSCLLASAALIGMGLYKVSDVIFHQNAATVVKETQADMKLVQHGKGSIAEFTLGL